MLFIREAPSYQYHLNLLLSQDLQPETGFYVPVENGIGANGG